MTGMEQAYLEKMFPNGQELPQDRLIPCLLMQGGRTEVIFLIKTGPEDAELLQPAHDSFVQATDITITPLPQKDGDYPDLRIAMELTYPERTVRFHGTISDAEGKKQAAVAKALLLVTRVALFAATYEFKFISFKAFDWSPVSQPALEEILRKASQDGIH